MSSWADRLLLFGKLMKEVGFPILIAIYVLGVLTGAFPSTLSAGQVAMASQLEAHRTNTERLLSELIDTTRRQNRIIGLLCTAAVEPGLKVECLR